MLFRSAPVALMAIGGYPRPDVATAVAMAALIMLRHRDNVRRMRAGTEPKVLPKKQATPVK